MSVNVIFKSSNILRPFALHLRCLLCGLCILIGCGENAATIIYCHHHHHHSYDHHQAASFPIATQGAIKCNKFNTLFSFILAHKTK